MAFEEYCFQLNRFHELFSPLLLYDCLTEENLKKKIFFLKLLRKQQTFLNCLNLIKDVINYNQSFHSSHLAFPILFQ